jgi:hypothetical protein
LIDKKTKTRGAGCSEKTFGCPQQNPWPSQDDKHYPLVNVYITMENHHFQWENPL